MSDKFQDFVLRGAPPERLDYACELFEAANDLASFNDQRLFVSSDPVRGLTKMPSHSRAVLFLFALSLENLLKGHLISENPEYISNGILSREVSSGGHPLVLISGKIKNVDFDEDEIDLLKVLESAIPSWGRYPIPKSHCDVSLETILDQDLLKKIRCLFERLEKSLFDSFKDGWRGPHQIILRTAISSRHE